MAHSIHVIAQRTQTRPWISRAPDTSKLGLTQPSELWSGQLNRLDNQTPLLSDVIEHKCEV